MSRRNKIIYWIATIWLSLGMVSSGIVQLIHLPEETEMMNRFGYPAYFMSILGAWKIPGVMVILLPRLPLLKEWAYAGFFFTMTGAFVSHLVCGDPAKEFFGPVLLIVLILISWYFRPAERKLMIANQ